MEVGQMKGKFVDEKYQIRVKRKSLQAVLEECQRALESLSNCEDGTDEGEDGKDAVNPQVEVRGVGLLRDEEADELRDLLRSRVQCSGFLEKLEFAQASVPENIVEMVVLGTWSMQMIFGQMTLLIWIKKIMFSSGRKILLKALHVLWLHICCPLNRLRI